MTPELLRQYLSFYQDLGIDNLYIRTQTPLPMTPLPGLAPDHDTLLAIQADIGDCKRCRLHASRNKIVFGDGKEQAKLVFVGEGPGADEDVQGLPFVGRAGQLLTQMIENTASKEGIPLKRQDVYICNVVKCRPPENRTPEAGRDGDVRTISVPAAVGDPPQGHLRARRDCRQSPAGTQRRGHQDERQLV